MLVSHPPETKSPQLFSEMLELVLHTFSCFFLLTNLSLDLLYFKRLVVEFDLRYALAHLLLKLFVLTEDTEVLQKVIKATSRTARSVLR